VFAVSAAYGYLVAAILAVVATWALTTRADWAIAMVWIFNVVGAVDFLKVVSGNANPVMLFMTGKLKAKGDLGLAANIANYFDIPKG